MSDPDTLQAVEVAVRENTSLRRLEILSYESVLKWTNVAEAILKGATKNKTLRTLHLDILAIPDEPLPPQQLIDDLRRSNSKLRLTVRAEGESPLLVIAHSSGSDFVCVACMVHLMGLSKAGWVICAIPFHPFNYVIVHMVCNQCLHLLLRCRGLH